MFSLCKIPIHSFIKSTFFYLFRCSVIDNQFLSIATFLDPRFQQQFTSADDSKPIRDELEKTVENSEPSANASTHSKASPMKNFGLSSLFSNVLPVAKTKPPKTRFDVEFRSYIEHACLNVQFCPLEWWADNERIYPNLKEHVKKYFCVPPFVSNVHRMSLADQEELEQKYERLKSNEPSEKLIWLHLNELRQRSFEMIKDD